MYICLSCGHVFEDGEERHIREWHSEVGASEYFEGCPVCGESFREAARCGVCGEYFDRDSLFDGYCENCLRDKVTYDKALAFLTETDQLVQFMFECVWESPSPVSASGKLKKVLREWFLRMKSDDLLRGKTDFMNLCERYILDDDGSFGKREFAEWLDSRKE